MSTFFDDTRDYIIDTLEDLEGCEMYGCDLPGMIMQGPNADGTLTYSRQASADYLAEHGSEMADMDDEISFQFGSISNFDGNINPFTDPEAYYVARTDFLVGYILMPIMDKIGFYDEERELTADDIAKITELVEEDRGTNPFI